MPGSIAVRNLQRKYDVSLSGVEKRVKVILELISSELEKKLNKKPPFYLSVAFVGEKRIAEINKTYRKKSGPTDVLSFPLWDERDGFDLGEVVICPAVAARQSPLFGTDYPGEMDRLLIHGILHLMGYDHEISASESQRMKAKERFIWRHLHP